MGYYLRMRRLLLVVVVDCFSKYAYFLPLALFSYHNGSTLLLPYHKLHGLPKHIVSDRDVTFTSFFWSELFKLSGANLSFNSAYHPQNDWQTKAVNHVIEMYLWCFIGDHPCRWMNWISWAEYCFNTCYESSLRTTFFEIIYGHFPPPWSLIVSVWREWKLLILNCRKETYYCKICQSIFYKLRMLWNLPMTLDIKKSALRMVIWFF